MLLRFFRINDPYRLLFILVLMTMTSLPFLLDPGPVTFPELGSFVLGEALSQGKHMYVQIIDSTAPLSAFVFGITDTVFGRSVTSRQVLAMIILFFQASFFAILLINNKAYNDSSYVPALIFAMLCFFSFDMLSFSEELLGSTVLLLALNYLFKEVEFRHERDEIILNLGVCLGVATLFVFSYIVFLFATIVILFIFTRPSVRKVLLLFFGFSLPHALLITLYYFRGESDALWQGFYGANLGIHRHMWISIGGLLTLAALPLLYFICSLLVLNREARFTKYQSQLFQLMFLWMLASVIQILVTLELSPHSLIIFIPSFSYFISHYILLIRRKWLAEAMLWGFFLGIFGLSMLARYDRAPVVMYDALLAKDSKYEIAGKHVMVATDEPGVYLRNKLAGHFLEYGLSRDVLDHPDYYENVLNVYASLTSDPPDIIIDPDDRMKGFFERIPELKTKYRRNGDLYSRITKP